MERIKERRQIAEAAKRIETAQSPSTEYADPQIRALLAHWQGLEAAAKAARRALECELKRHRDIVSASDRRVIREAKQRNPDLILLKTDGELLPVRCMVSGLALFEGDDVLGHPETGFAVLKRAVRVHPVLEDAT